MALTRHVTPSAFSLSRALSQLHCRKPLCCRPGVPTFRHERLRLPKSCVFDAANKEAATSPVASTLSTYKGLISAGISSTALSTVADCSNRIPYLQRCQVTDVPGPQASALADCLLSFGSYSASIEEYKASGQPEQEIFLDGTDKTWDRCVVTGLFPAEHDISKTLQIAQDILHLGPLDVEIEEVPDQEWVDAMKSSYQPTEVCQGLWIVPDWCQPPDSTALNIRMAPGLAFGTGEHETTRLCLQWLFANRQKLQGAHVMDYGTGSGVLAVAALLMGAASVVGTDVDPLAVKAARGNAELNAVSSRFTAVQCSSSIQGPDPVHQLPQHQPKQFDICIANILQGPLLHLQPRLSQYVKPGGQLLLSGILKSQVATVQTSYQMCFEDVQCATEKSWALLTGRKQ